MSILYWVLAGVALQRLAELALAAGNTSRLRRQGGIEADAQGYPLFVALHAAWLVSLAVLVPAATSPSWPLLGVFGLLQLGRVWVIASLGRRWTTRIIVVPGAAPVHRGPYRYVRHPNYLIVAGEIALLPLAFGVPAVAALFSAANLLLLARRVRLEDRALAAATAR
jgi:methyltransferase